MMTKTISNYYLENGSLLGAINSPIINGLGVEEMDSVLLSRFGDRILSKKMLQTPNIVLKSIGFIFNEKWEKVLALKGIDVDFMVGGGRKVSETINESGERVGVVEDVNSVTSFNSDDLIANDGRSSDNKEDHKRENERTLVDESFSINNIAKNLQISDKVNIINVVLEDVIKEVSLSIY